MRAVAAEIRRQIRVRAVRLWILLVSLLVDGQVTRRAPVHLRHPRKVHIVDDVGQDDLLDLQRRRHEVGHRRVAQQGLRQARRDDVEARGEATLLGLHVVDLLLDLGDLPGVLAKFRLHVLLLGLGFLPLQVELVDLFAKLVDLGFHPLRARLLRVTRDLVGIPVDVVLRFRELVVLGVAIETRVHVGELVLQFVDLRLVRFDVLPGRRQLLLELLLLTRVDTLLRRGELLSRHLHLELGEAALGVLPLAIEVVPHHPDRADEQHDARRGKDDVQEVDVVGVPD